MEETDPQAEVIKDAISNSDDDTFSYRGWLISDKFHRRLLALMGYQLIITIFFSVGYVVLLLILAFLFS